MRKQAAIAFTITLLTLSLLCTAQEDPRAGTGSITGRVVTLDGHPAENARVELREVLTGATAQASYTNPSGQFEFNRIPQGTYIVVATSQLDEARETVKVQQMGTDVVLHLPRSFNATEHSQSMVSVQQLKVPGKARAAFKRAQEALSKQNAERALQEVTKALAIYPQYAEALVLRGILKLDQEHPEAALNDFDEALKNDPSYPMAYIALGATYNRMSKFDDALRALDRGVALAPTSWQAYFEIGKAYLGRGEFTTSLRQLDKAQQFAPESYGPLHLLKAHALLGLKSYNEAISELEAYLSRDPKGQSSDEARDTLQKVRAFMANQK